MRINDLITEAHRLLKEAGVTEPGSDVYLLLGKVLEKSRTQLLLLSREEIGAAQEEAFRRLLARRCAREPVAYILGEQEFWSLPFHVDRNVLIPRPETEFLLECVFNHMDKVGIPAGNHLDLCCGSGAIAVVLAVERGLFVHGVDISGEALEVTRRNALRHGVADHILLVRTDLFSAIAEKRTYSLIVTNPPYINSDVVKDELDPEVRCYEPSLALDGGDDGMNFIRRIRHGTSLRLKSGGALFMEIGYDQGERVKKLFETPCQDLPSFSSVQILKDYAGKDRILSAVIE